MIAKNMGLMRFMRGRWVRRRKLFCALHVNVTAFWSSFEDSKFNM